MHKVMGRDNGGRFYFPECWKVECLTAALVSLPVTGIVKGMEMRMTKPTDGIESDDRERGWKEQCSDKKDEERRLKGGRVDCKENKWRKNNRKHDMHEGDREKVTVEKEGRQWDRRGQCVGHSIDLI